MQSDEGERRYFDFRYRVLVHYLERFPEGIDFKGKKILDLGCGHGALACTAANSGAREVLAVDINSRLVVPRRGNK